MPSRWSVKEKSSGHVELLARKLIFNHPNRNKIMSTTFLENANKETTFHWAESPNGYRCEICVIREDDGTFSVVVTNLPGCGSCGASEAEAIENAKEAIRGVIESYLDDPGEIPWVDSTDIPEGTIRKTTIVVNV